MGPMSQLMEELEYMLSSHLEQVENNFDDE